MRRKVKVINCQTENSELYTLLFKNMQKQQNNLFHEKFRLLNSQEHTADIKWTSSSSSEYENTPCKEKFCSLDKNRNRKRKRKKKVPKNVSNLDITIIDSCKGRKSNLELETSPILTSKRVVISESPILKPSRLPPNEDSKAKSPILCNKNFSPKSPILNFKSISPKLSVRVRKKLSYEKEDKHSTKLSKTDNLNKEIRKDDVDNVLKSETNSFADSDSSLKAKLMEKVKNFFDSNFSSENTSQNISDTPTPTDCSKPEDVEISSCRTQTVANIQTNKTESFSNSDNSFFDKNAKKVKHKKGGLAYRLNVLLKKQNAHVSLWQHERFLADNSNFVIPKEENVMFRIQSIDFNYGCYLLNAVDVDERKYFIVINCKYVNTNIIVDSVFKLYEPYKVLNLNQEYKIIINVCKYECVVIKE